ncbi:GIY-YIG nuclease family protein [Candidatus Roizmanbacteria bacterium]|nr:GIY-YIG nuclease family protein [Candidatus Roizmanbacteria bacterium]
MKYTVYVLKDESKYTYTGCTSNLEERIWEHNNKVTRSTRKGKNWKIVYTKDFIIKNEALKYERLLKSGKGRKLLKTWGVV